MSKGYITLIHYTFFIYFFPFTEGLLTHNTIALSYNSKLFSSTFLNSLLFHAGWYMIWKTLSYPVVRRRPVNITEAHPVMSPHPVTRGQVAAHLGSNSQDMMGMLCKHECILTHSTFKFLMVVWMYNVTFGKSGEFVKHLAA